MRKARFLPLLIAALLLPAAAAQSAEYSWNLSRDMMNGIEKNPKGRWAFMADPGGSGTSADYILLNQYTAGALNRWTSIFAALVVVGVPTRTYTETIDLKTVTFDKGLPVMNPGSPADAVVRWTSPITGVVSILGKVDQMQQSCGGQGIGWSLKFNDTVLQSGSNYDNGSTFSAHNVPVRSGSKVYFVLSGGVSCSWANVDLLITGHDELL